MSRLESWVLAFIPDRDQFLFQQGHHIILVFLRGQTEKGSAYMGCNTEIHFICMFCFSMFYNRMVNQCFCYIVSDQFCPEFLFDIFWLISMKVTESNGVFKFSERTFYRSP